MVPPAGLLTIAYQANSQFKDAADAAAVQEEKSSTRRDMEEGTSCRRAPRPSTIKGRFLSEVVNCVAVSPDSFLPCRHSTATALEFPDLSPELCGGVIRPLLEASDLLNFRTQLLPQRDQNRCGSGFSPAFSEDIANRDSQKERR
jgi:hypothetical protein